METIKETGEYLREKRASGKVETVEILGITCEVIRGVPFPDGKASVYTFTVPEWEPCTVVGRAAALRVIRGRLDHAVRNTMGISL